MESLYSKDRDSGFQRMKDNIIRQKIAHPLVLTGIIVLSVLSSVATAMFGLRAGAAVFIAFITLPFIYAIVAYPKVGILFTITLSFFLLWISKFGISFPVGTVMDGLLFLLVMGFLAKQKFKK